MKQKNFTETFNQEVADRYLVLSKMAYPLKENRTNLKDMKKLLKILIREPSFMECLAKSHQFNIPDNSEYFISRVS